MSDPNSPSQDQHEKSRDLAEEGLDKLVHGDEAEAKRLAEKAKAIDPSGVTEVVDDLYEDSRQDDAEKK
jgi:hypothetical protein